MANRLRKLDPHASPAALLGAELRELRLGRGLSLAGLGRLTHVSGDLLGKIEKADRRARPELLRRLDDVLQAEGLLVELGAACDDDGVEPAEGTLPPPICAETALVTLREVVASLRIQDHAMSGAGDVSTLVGYAHAAEDVQGRVGRSTRPLLGSAIAEAYQLAGWMSFDQGFPRRAERLLGIARGWADRAQDRALAAYVLGPNLSFVATYGGDAALGAERAYGAIGWARRSGNQRLTAFAMAIGARAHARLGETSLALDLLDHAQRHLDRHTPDERDRGWLAVFDGPALDGHRGSCLLDLGMPDRALRPLIEQDTAAAHTFVRNRVIWRLDRVDALLRIGEIDHACTDLLATIDGPVAVSISPRVRRRLRAIDLHLQDRRGPAVALVAERLGEVLSAAPHRGARVNG